MTSDVAAKETIWAKSTSIDEIPLDTIRLISGDVVAYVDFDLSKMDNVVEGEFVLNTGKTDSDVSDNSVESEGEEFSSAGELPVSDEVG